VVLVTDGALGIGRGSLRHSLQTVKQRVEDKKFPLPFPFPSKFYVMCIANAEEVLQSFCSVLTSVILVSFRYKIGASMICWPKC